MLESSLIQELGNQMNAEQQDKQWGSFYLFLKFSSAFPLWANLPNKLVHFQFFCFIWIKNMSIPAFLFQGNAFVGPAWLYFLLWGKKANVSGVYSETTHRLYRKSEFPRGQAGVLQAAISSLNSTDVSCALGDPEADGRVSGHLLYTAPTPVAQMQQHARRRRLYPAAWAALAPLALRRSQLCPTLTGSVGGIFSWTTAHERTKCESTVACLSSCAYFPNLSH